MNTPDKIKCPDCNGDGFTIDVEPECCGYLNDIDACCNRPIEKQVQKGCERCSCTGFIDSEPKLADIKFNWIETEPDRFVCRISDFELVVYPYYEDIGHYQLCMTLIMSSSRHWPGESTAQIVSNENITTADEGKQILEKQFLWYWNKLKSEIEK